MAKQPPVRSIPKVPVEVAVWENLVNEMPAAKVDVPCPAPTVIAPPKVEVAVPAAIKLPPVRRLPAFRLPATVEDPETKSAVVVAPVKVAFVNVALVPWMFVATSKLSVLLQVNELEPDSVVAPVQKVT